MLESCRPEFLLRHYEEHLEEVREDTAQAAEVWNYRPPRPSRHTSRSQGVLTGWDDPSAQGAHP